MRDLSVNEYGIGGLSLAAGGRHGWPSKELVSACSEVIERYSSWAREADDQTLLAVQLAEPSAAAFYTLTTHRPIGVQLERN